MKVVIDIDENYYEILKHDVKVNHMDYIPCVLIANGTPLPKGHGRLIDADSIYQIVRPIGQSDAEWGMTAETAIRLIYDTFNKAPTIIEADKGEQE